jgi:RNA polymerase sigma-70 factor (sigma-E family)
VATLADEFDAYVRSRTPALMRSAYLLTGDQHLAEDLVQSALISTHRSWDRLHHDGHPDAYTRKVMYHLQVSWWRRRRVAESLTGDLPEPRHGGATDDSGAAAQRLTLRAALLRLTPRQRAVLVLRYFEDLTEADTATALRVSVGTVKSQTFKALARLRTVAPELAEFATIPGGTR